MLTIHGKNMPNLFVYAFSYRRKKITISVQLWSLLNNNCINTLKKCVLGEKKCAVNHPPRLLCLVDFIKWLYKPIDTVIVLIFLTL